jgi:DNA mismatch repair protein MutL
VLQAGDLAHGQVVNTLLTSVACRAAVRRGVPLTTTEMEQLVARLAACAAQSMCPHGSPIVVRVGAGDLARHFGWP